MRICICEDDPMWRATCKKALADLGSQNGVEFDFLEYENGEQFLFAAEDMAASIDILFMEIHLPGADGFETVRRVQQYNFTGIVIFLAVSGERYPDAFDMRAFNYIERKVLAARLPTVLSLALQTTQDKNEDVISIACAGMTKNIPLSAILYFEINHSVVTVYYGDNQSMEFYSTMDKIEERLFGKTFLRVHRAFIVNPAKIREVRYCEITMSDGAVIPVSRSKMDEVRSACKA